jgi:NAD+ synthase
MKKNKVITHIVNWLNNYCEESKQKGFIIGVSGGIDSALTSCLCALTEKKFFYIHISTNRESLIQLLNLLI